tara:strand:- start:596 stop:2539 length:1944 start_codon:yes stop_codon:yes gene_type:complete
MSKEVIVTVKADTKNAQTNVKDLNEDLKETKTDLSGIESSADKATGGLISGFKGSIGAIKGVVKGFKTLRGAIIATGIGALVVVVSSLMAAFTDSEEGANKLSKILGVLGTVVDNVLDLFADFGEAIISAFENPKEALMSFVNLLKNQVVNRINGLMELIPALGKAVQLVFSGDFSEAGKVATNAVGKVVLGVEDVTEKIQAATQATKEFIAENIEEAKKAADVADMRAKAAKLERELLVERSILESKIADLRLKSRQEEEFTAAQRKQFLLDAQKLEDGLLTKETEVLELRRKAQEDENEFARSNIEALDKLAEAEAAVNRQSAIRLNQQRATQRELNTLNKQIQAENKRIANEKKAQDDAELKRKQEALKADEKARAIKKAADEKAQKEELERAKKQSLDLQMLRNTDLENELLELQIQYDKKIELAKGNNALIEALKKEHLEKVAGIENNSREKERQAKLQAANDALDIAANSLNSIQSLGDAAFAHRTKNLKEGTKEQLKAAKQQFNFNKALQLGMAVIDGGKAITASLAQSPLSIGPLPNPAGIASLAFASVTSAAQIAMIAAQKYEAPKKNTTTVSPPSIDSGGANTSPTQPPSFNVVGQSGFNQVAGALGQQQPIQAFVVAGDVTTAQQLQNNTITQATF